MQVEHPPNRLLAHYSFNEELVVFADADSDGHPHYWAERQMLEPFGSVFEHDMMPASPHMYMDHGQKNAQLVRDSFSHPPDSTFDHDLLPMHSIAWPIEQKPTEAWPVQHRAISPVRTMSSSEASNASFSPLASSAMTPQAFAPHLYSAPPLESAHVSPHIGTRCDSPPLPLAIFQVDAKIAQHSVAMSSSPTLSLHSASPPLLNGSPATLLTTPSAGHRAMSWDESSNNDESERNQMREGTDDDSDYRPSKSTTRRRNTATGRPRNKVTKRAPARRPSTLETPRLAAAGAFGEGTPSRRPEPDLDRRHFTCPSRPYGCPTTFATKNEWKRHVISQHLCLGFWRCDLCPDHHRHPNDFNRKDLFTQHLRRMHSPSSALLKPGLIVPAMSSDTAKSDVRPRATHRYRQKPAVRDGDFECQLESIRKRCWVQARQPPACLTCIFCGLSFTAESRCEDFLEHVGRHLAEAADRRELDIDECHERHASLFAKDDLFRDWMLQNGLLQHDANSRLELVARVNADTQSRSSAKGRQSKPVQPVVSCSDSVDAEGDPDD